MLWPTILADPDGIMLALTTPGYDQNGPAFKLYQRAKAGDTDRFYAQIHEPKDPDCSISDKRAWRQANPSIGHGLTMEDLAVAFANRTSDASWAREHMGMWTTGEAQWIHRATWDALADPTRVVEPGSRIFAAFDGWSRDSTAIVASTEDGFVCPIGLWEKPPWDPDWRVPRAEVEDTVAGMFAMYDVMELACDPAYWEREVQDWAGRYGPERVIEFPPVRQRMAPACTAFHGAVMEGRLSHSGDERLARHIANAVTKPSPFGDFITKADKDSPLKIDAAIAAVIAHHRAATRVPEPARAFRVW